MRKCLVLLAVLGLTAFLICPVRANGIETITLPATMGLFCGGLLAIYVSWRKRLTEKYL
jgi:PEP-CTERM motif